jgi:hypothetical protein
MGALFSSFVVDSLTCQRAVVAGAARSETHFGLATNA